MDPRVEAYQKDQKEKQTKIIRQAVFKAAASSIVYDPQTMTEEKHREMVVRLAKVGEAYVTGEEDAPSD